MALRERITGVRDRSVALDCLGIALGAIAVTLVVRPFRDTPFVDDWTYAWSVEHLLKTGDLRILDISASINVSQIVWGAIFCLPFGFSFTALRVSTWVLSTGCLVGLYLLLRELGVSRRDALIGTAALATYPVYFVLSFTFMTDVPALASAINRRCGCTER